MAYALSSDVRKHLFMHKHGPAEDKQHHLDQAMKSARDFEVFAISKGFFGYDADEPIRARAHAEQRQRKEQSDAQSLKFLRDDRVTK